MGIGHAEGKHEGWEDGVLIRMQGTQLKAVWLCGRGLPSIRLVETLDELDAGALAAAGGADEGHFFTRLHLPGDTVEDLFVRL